MMKILKNNYHTHTFRCGHASGQDEDYVLEAIHHGMDSLGFSDHIPMHGRDYTFLRMPENQLEDYIQSILSLKQKYQDQIKIHLGLEAEFLDSQQAYYRYLLDQTPIEYLILGGHYIHEAFAENASHVNIDRKKLEAYVAMCIDGMKSGLYLYLAHPDLYMKKHDVFDENCLWAAHEICKASLKYQFPIEINCEGYAVGLKEYAHGTIHRYRYPVEEFWKIAGEYQCPVVIGVDAHKSTSLNGDGIQKAFDLAKRHHLRLIKDNRLL